MKRVTSEMMDLVLQFSFKLFTFLGQMTYTLKSTTKFKRRQMRVQIRSWQFTITTNYIQSTCKLFTTVDNICAQKQVFILLVYPFFFQDTFTVRKELFYN